MPHCCLCGYEVDKDNLWAIPTGAGSQTDGYCVCKTCYAKHFQQPASQPRNPTTETDKRARIHKRTPTYRQPPKQLGLKNHLCSRTLRK